MWRLFEEFSLIISQIKTRFHFWQSQLCEDVRMIQQIFSILLGNNKMLNLFLVIDGAQGSSQLDPFHWVPEIEKLKKMFVFCTKINCHWFSVGKGGAHYAGNKSTPKVTARRKNNLAKKEGVTKIGNNVYFYTGYVRHI